MPAVSIWFDRFQQRLFAYMESVARLMVNALRAGSYAAMMYVGFVVGALGFSQMTALPSGALMAGVGILALALFADRRGRVLGAMGLGWFYAAGYGLLVIDDRLPASAAGHDLEVVGQVVSLPQHRDRSTRFRFRPEGEAHVHLPRTLLLTTYDKNFRPVAGERWQMTVRLSRPRGLVNPDLFDYEGWLLAEGIGATGYVRLSPAPIRVAAAGSFNGQGLRASIAERISRAPLPAAVAGLLIALSIGESAAIGSDNWTILSRTGTNHLFIISGLHVGLVAGAGWWIARRVLGQGIGAALVALSVSLGYGLIAGMGLPVQRALVMSSVWIAGLTLSRSVPARSLLGLALGCVTLVNPFATLSPGFWLSFGAVCCLMLVFSGSIDWRGRVWARLLDLIRSQWIVFIGTAAILLDLVGQLSLVSMAANLIAIPFVSVLVIPALLVANLVGELYEPASSALLVIVGQLLQICWALLEWLASLDAVVFAVSFPPIVVLAAALGVVVLVVPASPLPRWPALLLWLPIMTFRPADLTEGQMRIHVMDVGQGLSVLIETADEVLLYDAGPGPAHGSGFDAGEQIVVPTLRRRGHFGRIDTFVVSHRHLDHAGGAPAVRRNMLINRTLLPGRRSDCTRPRQWVTGNTRVNVQPIIGSGSENDRSCVVWIASGGHRVMLPGDIEQMGEAQLTALAVPAVDVLIVPHHGSQTSSSPALLNLLEPDIAIVSSRRGNRFGHPHDEVVARYLHRGIRFLNTADSGAVTVTLSPEAPPRIDEARFDRRRFWYD